ncbi:MAG: hypothetical protein MJ071_07780 [Oscillospiraceae bacterium]|nr:hypothetical protein [Oscillospiraceae bacterium]
MLRSNPLGKASRRYAAAPTTMGQHLPPFLRYRYRNAAGSARGPARPRKINSAI